MAAQHAQKNDNNQAGMGLVFSSIPGHFHDGPIRIGGVCVIGLMEDWAQGIQSDCGSITEVRGNLIVRSKRTSV